MTRKVIKVGSSSAVTLPKEVLDGLGIEDGDEVRVMFNKETGQGIIETVVKKETNQKLVDWTKKFIDRYRPALEELAEK